MAAGFMKRTRGAFFVAAMLAAGACGVGAPNLHERSEPSPAPLRVLILGGGFDLAHNQAAIESNVRYVHRLLPKGAAERVLFTDGMPQSKSVLCEDGKGKQYFRRPQLPRLDGASTAPGIASEFQRLASGPAAPVLLYATGHGSHETDNFDNNRFDLWNNRHLTVSQLSAQIGTLPESTPVTVVMAQCFSGKFGDILFEGGDPKAPLVERDIRGFFASIAERPAAGCTAAINEADYHDFTGYFFAALSGVSRQGRPVTGADYNHDGRVGMDEAFAYTLIHDNSIDTPVCTSDVFLRRFVPSTGNDFTAPSWSELLSWATPAQKAALGALSADLHLAGEARLQDAYALFQKTPPDVTDLPGVHVIRLMRLAKSVVLAHWLTTSDADADQPWKERYKRLKAAEARGLLL